MSENNIAPDIQAYDLLPRTRNRDASVTLLGLASIDWRYKAQKALEKVKSYAYAMKIIH